MKRVVCVLCITVYSLTTFAQTQEVGIGIGISNFLGDLGKKEPNKRTYFGDLEGSLFRPAVSVFYKNHFNHWAGVKIAFTYGVFEGDDRLARSEEFGDDAWFRNYRNLHFKSHVFELSAIVEANLMKYIPGSMRYRMAPFVFAGIAVLRFNPKAEYNGEWVSLQPLGTEGQGMSQYPDRQKYARFQPTIPLGFGFKFNINTYLAMSIEFGHRFTFTDYLDDVSTNYVSEGEFINQYGLEKGTMAYEISRRSAELDPEESYGSITTPGEVRGNPAKNDSYLFSTVSIAYKFANKFSEYAYSRKRNSVRRNPVSRKRTSKYKRHIKNKTW